MKLQPSLDDVFAIYRVNLPETSQIHSTESSTVRYHISKQTNLAIKIEFQRNKNQIIRVL